MRVREERAKERRRQESRQRGGEGKQEERVTEIERIYGDRVTEPGWRSCRLHPGS